MTVWVVFVGCRPGIYNTWGEAKTQVEGFPNNCHKSYDKREDAENGFRAFCTGGPSPTRGKVYAVFVGRKPGIYSSWYEAKKQVDGFPNNSFRAFKIRDDAEKAVAEFASSMCREPDIDSGIPFKADAITADPPAYASVFSLFDSGIPFKADAIIANPPAYG
ncbi:Hypothetical predicted protein [Olea europaea subsp. europaea]|uniref:Ribonuclease H n=1 Tax=Olea europaea subsp. europaea TaxID=158383 RepID=A0A8S0PSD3_OLEEU|nr:Hypothetical predicted protein [Olea europaea subsp. europaea]